MAPHLDKMNQILYSDSWYEQWTKKVVSKSPELVDFALGLVNSVLNLLMGKWSFWGIQITEELKSMLNKILTLELKWLLGKHMLAKAFPNGKL